MPRNMFRCVYGASRPASDPNGSAPPASASEGGLSPPIGTFGGERSCWRVPCRKTADLYFFVGAAAGRPSPWAKSRLRFLYRVFLSADPSISANNSHLSRNAYFRGTGPATTALPSLWNFYGPARHFSETEFSTSHLGSIDCEASEFEGNFIRGDLMNYKLSVSFLNDRVCFHVCACRVGIPLEFELFVTAEYSER